MDATSARWANVAQGRRATPLILVLVLSVIFSVLGSPMSARAESTGSQATIESVVFPSERMTGGAYENVTATWKAPSTQNFPLPLSFTVKMPDEIKPVASRFPFNGSNGQPAGNCVAAATEVKCVVDDQYATDFPAALRGTVTFRSLIWKAVSEDTRRTFQFGDVTSNEVTITPSEMCSVGCDYTGQAGKKQGQYTQGATEKDPDIIPWMVMLPAGPQGTPPGTEVRITDVLDPDLYELVSGSISVMEAQQLIVQSNGVTRELFSKMPAKLYTTAVNGSTVSISFTSREGLSAESLAPGRAPIAGAVYYVSMKVKVLHPKPQTTYSNTACYQLGAEPETCVTGSVHSTTNAGSAEGTDTGKFAVTAVLAGDVPFATPPTLTVRYISYKASDPNDPGTPGEAELKPDGTFTSGDIKLGQRVVITGVSSKDTPSLHWKVPQVVQLDGAGNPVAGSEPGDSAEILFSAANQNLDVTTPFRVTFEAVQNYDVIRANAVVANPDGVDLTDRQYVLDYSYPAGPSWIAGAGSMTVDAEGSVLTSDPIPVGAKVSFDAQLPAAVPGATWATPKAPAPVIVGEQGEAIAEGKWAISQDVGAFSVKATVSGTGAGLVPEGTEFVVRWSYEAGPGYPAAEGTIEVTAGGPAVQLEGIPAGAVVSLSQAAPEGIVGAAWQGTEFSAQSFTVVQDKLVELTTNTPIVLGTGDIRIASGPVDEEPCLAAGGSSEPSAENAGETEGEEPRCSTLTGTGLALLLDETRIVVQYSYPAGNGFAAGSGELSIGIDGTWTSSEPLPFGAEVVFGEIIPGAVPGATWKNLTVSVASVKIGHNSTADVVLSGELVRDVGSFDLQMSASEIARLKLSDSQEFTYDYSYPAGDTFPAGEGSFTARDGVISARTENLPAGAVVTLKSTTSLPQPSDGKWKDIQFTSGETLTIVKNENVTAQAVVDFSEPEGGKTPEPSETGGTGTGGSDGAGVGKTDGKNAGSGSDSPRQPDAAPPAALSVTGAEIAPWVLGLALLMMLSGAAVYVRARVAERK